MGRSLCFCLLLCYFLLLSSSSARNTLLFSQDEGWSMGGRSLKVSLEDYGETTANHGHDPSRNWAKAGNGGGRKG